MDAGFHFSFKMEDRLLFFQFQQPADFSRCQNSFDPLISALDFNPVIIPEYLEKRFVLKLP